MELIIQTNTHIKTIQLDKSFFQSTQERVRGELVTLTPQDKATQIAEDHAGGEEIKGITLINNDKVLMDRKKITIEELRKQRPTQIPPPEDRRDVIQGARPGGLNSVVNTAQNLGSSR